MIGWANLFDLSLSFERRKTDAGRRGSVMPGLTFTPRYHKLDDRIFLLCKNCGHSVKTEDLKKMAATTSTGTRFRSSSKHFLTWSATAANHKIQKLSKNFVQNVSRLQNKMEKALATSNNNAHQAWDPSCMENNETASPSPLYNNGSSTSSSAHLVGNSSTVNVAVVHALNVTRKKSSGESVSNNNSNLLSPGSEWKSSARLRRRFDFEAEKCNLAKSLDGIDMDMLELRPMGSASGNRQEGQDPEDQVERVKEPVTLVTGTYNLHTSSSSNNTSLSTISIGATTLPITSPHWSRASSMSNSVDSSTSSSRPGLPFDRRKIEDEENNNHRCSSSFDSSSIRVPLLHHSASSLLNVHVKDSGVRLLPLASSTPTQLTLTIFEEEAELRTAPWFQAGIPREIALEVLKNEPIGSFIVRESTTKSGCFALSLRVPRETQPRGIAHYLILKTSRGFKIKGFTKEFKSLTQLITHHSVMPELLPCPLSLHLYRPKRPVRVSRLQSPDFMEPDQLFTFRRFTDF